jgi:NitT/TauT family transport system ATP-binding protein
MTLALERTADAETSDAPPAQTLGGRIVIDDLSVVYRRGATESPAVERISLTIEAGAFVCLLGPSGCGKSTLLGSIAGHVRQTGGRVLVDGVEIVRPGPDRGMVFQQYSLFPWKSVRDNVAFGPYVSGLGRRKAREVADALLEMVGLARFADRYPAELSGGMQQRVGIARALANRPRVLLMDEPFGALDAQTRIVMQEHLLRLWAKFNTTVVFVTHDVDEAIFLADRVLIMSAGPGRIIGDVPVPLPRPRTPEVSTDAAFVALKRLCLKAIRTESLKAFEDQER